MFIDFLKENYLACIVVALATIIMIFILSVAIIQSIKKRNQAKLEKMLTEIPVIPDEEVAVTEVVHENRREGNAELIWVREQSLGENNQGEPISINEDVKPKKEEKKTVKTVSKSTTKSKTAETAKKTATKPKKTTSSSTAKQTKKVVGKWVVREKGEGEFVSFLHASNGEIMLTSEIYSTAEGAKRGISTIKKSIAGEGFQLYCDKNRNYYFKLKTAQNRFLCVGETYPTKASCISAIDSVKRFADAPISEEVEKDVTLIQYVIPKEEVKVDKNTAYSGKWIVTDVEDMYIAQLFASNGELLLSSEAYTTISSAKASIETITTNGLAGNFIIDVDKKGRFFFKLRNDKKSTLCVGESYSQLSKCQNAIDSVRRFLKTAKLAD
ncbi:MAG: YegP family protein [Clostridia bacterium]|nr:YegP family protein [Clostridia bacterium]